MNKENSNLSDDKLKITFIDVFNITFALRRCSNLFENEHLRYSFNLLANKVEKIYSLGGF